MIYTVELTDVQDKALRMITPDPQGWIENAVFERCRVSQIETVASETSRMIADPEVKTILADADAIMLAASLPDFTLSEGPTI